jgi:MFS family permease
MMLERLGRKNSIIIGFVVVVLATSALALTVLIEDDSIFLIVSIIARFIQGMGDMWVQTSCMKNLFNIDNRLLIDDM